MADGKRQMVRSAALRGATAGVTETPYQRPSNDYADSVKVRGRTFLASAALSSTVSSFELRTTILTSSACFASRSFSFPGTAIPMRFGLSTSAPSWPRTNRHGSHQPRALQAEHSALSSGASPRWKACVSI